MCHVRAVTPSPAVYAPVHSWALSLLATDDAGGRVDASNQCG